MQRERRSGYRIVSQFVFLMLSQPSLRLMREKEKILAAIRTDMYYHCSWRRDTAYFSLRRGSDFAASHPFHSKETFRKSRGDLEVGAAEERSGETSEPAQCQDNLTLDNAFKGHFFRSPPRSLFASRTNSGDKTVRRAERCKRRQTERENMLVSSRRIRSSMNRWTRSTWRSTLSFSLREKMMEKEKIGDNLEPGKAFISSSQPSGAWEKTRASWSWDPSSRLGTLRRSEYG